MLNAVSRHAGRRRPPCSVARILLPMLTLLGAPSGLAGDDRGAGRGTAVPAALTGFTLPQHIVTLASVRMGRIATIHVEEGDLVSAGQVVVDMDSTVQQRRVAIAQALAESTLAIEMAEVRLRQAQAELQRVTSLDDDHAVSAKELRDAQANAEAAVVALAQARFQHAQARREFALQQALLEELQIRAPFAGYVSSRLKHAGDVVEEREAILELVQLDPLIVQFDCPLPRARELAPGDAVRVRPLDQQRPPRTARVAFVSRVADAASQTCRVKLQLENAAAEWVAGMEVAVEVAAATASNTRPDSAAAKSTQPLKPRGGR